MKRLAFITFVIVGISFLSPNSTHAQQRAGNIQGLRIEFITKYLKLTQEEAPFWTLFYDYNDEVRKVRAETPDDIITTEEKVLIIRKKYRDEFKKILISDDRVLKVFTIDRDFNNLLKAEMEKRNADKKNNK